MKKRTALFFGSVSICSASVCICFSFSGCYLLLIGNPGLPFGEVIEQLVNRAPTMIRWTPEIGVLTGVTGLVISRKIRTRKGQILSFAGVLTSIAAKVLITVAMNTPGGY